MLLRFAWAALLLAFCVVILGAYVRLSDAGLGCPDWPGCYGRLDVPDDSASIAAANDAYPDRPVEVSKAWKEMVHRYAASVLGLLIIALAIAIWRKNRAFGLPIFLVALVVFQGLLGMWTVTWQLKPAVVTAHLLGGFATLALLWWIVLRHSGLWQRRPLTQDRHWRPWALLGLVIVIVQIALGGWTSSNYAALACPDFPTCQAQWWPAMDFEQAFVVWRELGVNYEYGVLDSAARSAIHMIHRLGAVAVLLYIGGLVLSVIYTARSAAVRGVGAAIGGILLLQLGLGVANVVWHLPLPVAVAHNGCAALLLLALVTFNHLLRPRVTT